MARFVGFSIVDVPIVELFSVEFLLPSTVAAAVESANPAIVAGVFFLVEETVA